jgi:hypothetical protein
LWRGNGQQLVDPVLSTGQGHDQPAYAFLFAWLVAGFEFVEGLLGLREHIVPVLLLWRDFNIFNQKTQDTLKGNPTCGEVEPLKAIRGKGRRFGDAPSADVYMARGTTFLGFRSPVVSQDLFPRLCGNCVEVTDRLDLERATVPFSLNDPESV